MGDFSASFSLLTQPWQEFQLEVKVASDRATMYGLRAVGRRVAARARAAAPVYKGDDPRAQAESGNLKKSIKSGRNITRDGSGYYQLNVMPVGSIKKGTAVTRYGNNAPRASTLAKRRAKGSGATTSGEVRGVPLYRRQMEQMYHYMQSGMNDGMGVAVATYEDAYRKAFVKWGPG